MKKLFAVALVGLVALGVLFGWPKLMTTPAQLDTGPTLKAASLVSVDPPSDYGWVDRAQGVAHIPIERAMDIVAEKELPWGTVAAEPEPVAVTPNGPVATEGGEKKPATPSLDPAMVQIGQALFTMYRCGGCHVAGSAYPQLNGKYGTRVPLEGGEQATFDDAYILESMVAPNAKIASGYKPIMPAYKDRIPEDEMKKIVLYIRSLR